jgi:hypothetical protein
MLLCSNIVILGGFLIIYAAKSGRNSSPMPIIAAMNDADELARRYFALWAEYLTALVADPQTAEMLQRWIAFTGQFAKSAGESGGSPFPAWPPIPAGFPASGPKAAASTVAGASGERDDAVGELAQRVGELERRLAALERRPAARRPSRGNRASGK